MRLDIRRIGSVKEGDEVTGNETRVKVVKNKVSPPFKQAEFQIMYGLGINQEGEILDFEVNLVWLRSQVLFINLMVRVLVKVNQRLVSFSKKMQKLKINLSKK